MKPAPAIPRVLSVTFTAVALTLAAHSQSNPALQDFFLNDIHLSQEQIASIRSGEAVTKSLTPRNSKEVFLFGATYIHADPNDYVKYASNVEHLRQLPGYLALGVISSPPRLSDFEGFSFDADDIKAIRNCNPGDCLVQLPASTIQDFQRAVDWTSPNAAEQVGDLLQKLALARLQAYQREGNQALGVYNDKQHPTDVADQFKFMLSYSKAFPKHLPQFYQYLLDYPAKRPPSVEDAFYWARVKFGLKPTLRAVHVLTYRVDGLAEPGWVIAEKQLYSSHYFETALDLTFCIAERIDGKAGFYLITLKGSEQEGLGGFKGTFVRKAATDRSTKALRESLVATREALEKRALPVN